MAPLITDAWRELAPSFGSDQLGQFGTLAASVLGELDPRYDLAPNERFHAPLHGKVLSTSPALRSGIAASLVRLTEEPFPADVRARGIGRGCAEAVIRSALTPGWRAWASTSDVLPVLCEAAPRAFMRAVEESLATDDGVTHLFTQEDHWGASPHTGLLWAVEKAAWHEGTASRAILALAALASQDPGGRLANRPGRSLGQALHPFVPESRTTADQRANLVARVLELYPDVGWSLAVGQLETPMGMILKAPRAEIAEWGQPSEPEVVDAVESSKQLERVCEIALGAVASEPSRWPDLIAILNRMHEPCRGRILDRLESVADDLEDATEPVREKLRKQLRFRRLGNRPDDALAIRMQHVYDRISPSDALERGAWLFTQSHIDLPEPEEDWGASEARVAQLRREVVDGVLTDPGKLDDLARFASRVAVPRILGAVLGEMPEGKTWCDALIRAAPLPAELMDVLGALVYSLERTGVKVTLDIVRQLHAAGQHDEAVHVALASSPSVELWDLLDHLGGDLPRRYWRSGVRLWALDDERDWERGLERLLEAGVLAVALDQAGSFGAHKGLVRPEMALSVLEHVLRADETQAKRIFEVDSLTYCIEQLLERVDAAPTIPDDRVVTVELGLLPLLRDSQRGLGRLGSALANQPELFVKFLCMLYLDAREPRDNTKPDEVKQHLADRAYHVLDQWRGVPGHTDETLNEAALSSWVDRVLALAAEEGRERPAVSEVAKVLARAPAPEDGVWPCLTARRMIEELHPQDLGDALSVARRNMRGVTRRKIGEGGRQEKRLAKAYSEKAATIEASWPRTASLLREIARYYEQDAEREDAEAAADRSEYGLDEDE